jgi:hypothetical protein
MWIFSIQDWRLHDLNRRTRGWRRGTMESQHHFICGFSPFRIGGCMTVIGGQEAGGEGPWRVNIISRMLAASSPWREIQLTDRASTGTNKKLAIYEKIYSTYG